METPAAAAPAVSPARRAIGRVARLASAAHPADLAAAAVGALLVAFYLWRLDAYRINDDEGSYLYAAWRISLGELPYRDFLTPQLPAFLLPGGWLMAWTGPGAWPARAVAAGLTLATGAWTWATARRLFGPGVACLALALGLLHPEVFLNGRTFRSEPFMLFFDGLAVYAFARAAFPRVGAVDPPVRRWLAVAGVGFGLATLAKLFGPLPMAGCLAWLAVDGWRRGRPLAAMARDAAVVVVAWAATVAVGLGVFVAMGAPVYESVLGHHLRQGAQKTEWQVLADTLAFYTAVLRYNEGSLLVFVAAAAGLMAWQRADRPVLLFAWQLPTLLAFAVLSREKFPRHFMYITPALAVLYAVAVRDVLRAGRAAADGPMPRRRLAGRPRGLPSRAVPPLAWLALALALAPLVPWRLLDRDVAGEWEVGTERIADFIDLVTAPGDIVLTDYSELNFYAQRPTTYAAASLSAGAAGSGQITWARLLGELGGRKPPLVLLDLADEFSHTHFLTDREAFAAWLADHYGKAVGRFRRHHQLYAVYAPLDRPLPERARFAAGPRLLAARPDRETATGGETVDILTAWQATEPITDDLGVTVRLVDADGLEWGQADGGLFASDGGDLLRVRPTSRWQARELTAERVPFPLPVGLPAGTYDVVLGVYRRRDAVGLDVVDAGGVPLGGSVTIGRLAVRPWRADARDVPAAALDLDLRPAARAERGVTLLGRGPLPDGPVEAGTLLTTDLWVHVAGAASAVVRLTLSDASSGAMAADAAVTLAPWGPQADGPGAEGAGVVLHQRAVAPVMAHAGAGEYRLGATVVEVGGQPVPGAVAVDLGTVTVAARAGAPIVTTLPRVDRPRDAAFDGVGALAGVDVPAAVPAGAALEVALVWRAAMPTVVGYAVSVQLIGPDGRPVAQHDGAPDGGARPTTGWVPGEIVIDRHALAVPADLPPGRYDLIAAVYHPVTGARRAVRGADGRGDAAALGTVEVR